LCGDLVPDLPPDTFKVPLLGLGERVVGGETDLLLGGKLTFFV